MLDRDLDGRTVRACAKRLEERAEALRKFHESKGWRRSHFLHRATELEAMAEMLRGTASLQRTAEQGSESR